MIIDEDRSRTRSLVISQVGVIASESVLGSQVGARILEGGGNAVDAAVAANAVLGLVAPMNDGIGGDLFAIVYEAASGRLHGLNASGWAPAALSAEYLRAQGMAEMPQQGIHSVTVPGAVAGWSALLRRFGSRAFAFSNDEIRVNRRHHGGTMSRAFHSHLIDDLAGANRACRWILEETTC